MRFIHKVEAALGGALVGAGIALALNWNPFWSLLSVVGIAMILGVFISIKVGR